MKFFGYWNWRVLYFTETTIKTYSTTLPNTIVVNYILNRGILLFLLNQPDMYAWWPVGTVTLRWLGTSPYVNAIQDGQRNHTTNCSTIAQCQCCRFVEGRIMIFTTLSMFTQRWCLLLYFKAWGDCLICCTWTCCLCWILKWEFQTLCWTNPTTFRFRWMLCSCNDRIGILYVPT